MLEKISSADIDGFLVKAAATIRDQEATISELRSDLAGKERHEHAEKIASAAVDRGIMDESEAKEYAESLVPLGSALTKTASASLDDHGEPVDVLTAFLTNNPYPE
jgi:hypothetical protein